VPGEDDLVQADTVERAVLLSREDDPVATASFEKPATSRGSAPTATVTRAKPSPGVVDDEVDADAAASSVRIVDSRSADRAGPSSEEEEDSTTSVAPAFRVTADESSQRDLNAKPTVREVRRVTPDMRRSQTAITNDRAVLDNSEGEGEGREAPRPRPGLGSRFVGAPAAGYAFAPDYAWLRGRLEYSQNSRQWKLRYIPIDGQTDRFGGSVVLGNSPTLEAVKPGDMVSVQGSLAARASIPGSFSPLYQINALELTP
jgi:hypothetical protein